MHLAICDDNADELFRIATILEQYRSDREGSVTYETFHSAADLLETMQKRRFDVLLLDILMPGMTGMEAAKEIRQWNRQIPILFLTSSREFAVESYRVSAEDYLMKPAQQSDIFSVLDKLLAEFSREEDYLTLKTADGVIRLPFSGIVYVEVMNRNVQFVLPSGEIKEIHGYLSDFEADLLAAPNFIKPHRSYLVNLQHVTELGKTGLATTVNKIVPVARNLFVRTKAAYMKYLLTRKGNK